MRWVTDKTVEEFTRFLKSPEGRKASAEIAEKIGRKYTRQSNRVSKLAAWAQDHDLSVLFDKMIASKKELHLLHSVIFEYACEAGVSIETECQFHHDSYVLDGYVITITVGQGSFYSLEKISCQRPSI